MASAVNLEYSDKKELDDFNDFTAVAQNYKSLMIVNAFQLLLLMTRVIFVLRLNQRLNLMLMIVEIAAKNIITYIILVFPIMLAFIYVGVLAWGDSFLDYRSFNWSFTFNILFYMGSA
mmetsp:Transcript_15517/g.2587  ORF Transcript_15517/g.2587 Transcript_15517/m.2587 type:complete len:118 (+) Transcript_15517:155-508(+)